MEDFGFSNLETEEMLHLLDTPFLDDVDKQIYPLQSKWEEG